MKVVNSSVVELIMTVPYSKYELSETIINAYKQLLELLTQNLKQELKLPRNVTLKGILKDDKGREISTAKF